MFDTSPLPFTPSIMDKEGLAELEKENKKCKQCTLYAGCRGKVFGDIGSDTKVIFIGESPGSEEDLESRPFVGPSGKLLRKWINDVGLHEDEFSILNVICCRPPNNRAPIESEKQACGKWLEKKIELIGCNNFVLLGRVACDYFLSDAGIFDGAILRHVGNVYIIGKRKFLVLPHPSFVLRGGGHYKVPLDRLKDFVGV